MIKFAVMVLLFIVNIPFAMVWASQDGWPVWTIPAVWFGYIVVTKLFVTPMSVEFLSPELSKWWKQMSVKFQMLAGSIGLLFVFFNQFLR